MSSSPKFQQKTNLLLLLLLLLLLFMMTMVRGKYRKSRSSFAYLINSKLSRQSDKYAAKTNEPNKKITYSMYSNLVVKTASVLNIPPKVRHKKPDDKTKRCPVVRFDP